MSYILDALRRADSERERGAVPGLHTQGLPPLTGEDPVVQRASAWVWAGAAAAALLVAGFAWALLRPDAAPRAPRVAAAAPAPVQAPAVALAPVVPPQAPAAQPPAPTPRAEAVAATPAPPLPAPLPVTATAALTPPATPAVTSPTTPAVNPTVTPAAPPTVTAPITATISPPRQTTVSTPPGALETPRGTAAALPSPTGAAKPAAPVARAAPSDAAPAPRIHALHELPDDVRRAIPALVVNGSVYSKNPADRFLIVNGQIVHELGSVAPDVVIETIGPRAAVLSALGHRFEISY